VDHDPRRTQWTHRPRVPARAERLLLWAIIVRRKPLSSLNTLDCREYINGFLADPQPAERWIGNGKAERFDPAWRPFAKKLPPASRETARKILSALCSWLVEEQFLRVNPFHGLQKVDSAKPLVDVTGRTLTHAQWRFVLQTVSRVSLTPAQQRDYFALLFAYATGLRRDELASATAGALSRKALDAALGDAWTLMVMGKGRRERRVPMPPRLMDELAACLQLRPVPCTLDTAPAATPLIAHLKTGKPLTRDALARLYKAIFKRAADALAPQLPRCRGGPETGQHALAAQHACESRVRRRQRPAGRADGPGPRQSRHDDALHQGGRGTPIPGRGAVF
jgi:integrase